MPTTIGDVVRLSGESAIMAIAVLIFSFVVVQFGRANARQANAAIEREARQDAQLPKLCGSFLRLAKTSNDTLLVVLNAPACITAASR